MNIATTAIGSAILLGLLGVAPVHSDEKGFKVSPAHLKFGKVQAGQTSTAKTVTLSNRADVAVSIQSVTPSGPFAVKSNSCGSQLAAKPATCMVSVTFNPTSAGKAKKTTQHGKLTIDDGAAKRPQVVTLSGIALRAEPTPTMTPTPTATPTPTLTPGILVTSPAISVVTIYPLDSNGDVTPSATIAGPDTDLNAPVGVAVDSGGNIYVANAACSSGSGADSVTVYPPGSNGDEAPIRVIEGDQTGLVCPVGVAVDSIGEIYVANCGELCGGGNINPSVTVYPAGSNGNAIPSVTISGSNTLLDYPGGIAVDSTRNIYVSNLRSPIAGGVPATAVYPAGSNGNVTPSVTVYGGRTVAVDDSSGDIYVAIWNSEVGTIWVFTSSGAGPIATLSTLTGANTVCGVQGIALDSTGDIYTANDAVYGCDALDRVNVYPSGSNGDIAPIAIIEGNSTGLQNPRGIAIGPVAP